MSHGTFGYQKIFGEEEFFAAGLLHIPVGAQKSAKNSRDNAYVSSQFVWPVGSKLIVLCEQAFHVFQGCVKVLVHKHQFVIAEGGQFMVPRGKPHEDVLPSHSIDLILSQSLRQHLLGHQHQPAGSENFLFASAPAQAFRGESC
jgi:centromere protein C